MVRRAVLLLAVVALAFVAASGVAFAATTYTDRVSGVEISAGRVVDDTRVGATFVGYGSGELPGVLASSINYTPPRPGPSVTNHIVGGGWVLKGQWGILRGSFVGDTVRWNQTGTKATVDARMKISGGTIRGKKVYGGNGSFKGTLNHLTFPPTVRGTLTLTPSHR